MFIATRGFGATQSLIEHRKTPTVTLIFENPLVELIGAPAGTVTAYPDGDGALRITRLNGNPVYTLVLIKCELSEAGCKELFGVSPPDPQKNWSLDPLKLLQMDESDAALTVLSFTGYPVIPASELGLCEESLQALRYMRSDSVQALALHLLADWRLVHTALKKEPDFRVVLEKVMARLTQMEADNNAELLVLNDLNPRRRRRLILEDGSPPSAASS